MKFKSLFALICVAILSTTAHAADWTKLTTEEVKALYTESRLSGRATEGPFKIYFGSTPGCGQLDGGNGAFIQNRTYVFNDDGTYTIEKVNAENDDSPGVETDGKKYRWIEDKVKFKVKKLKPKKVAKWDKKLAEYCK